MHYCLLFFIPSHCTFVNETCLLTWIVIFSSSADDSFQDFLNTHAIVQSDGRILWMFPAVMKTYCSLDVKHFPFDSQHCQIIFISWTFNGYKLNLNFNDSEHHTIYYTPRNQVHFVRTACMLQRFRTNRRLSAGWLSITVYHFADFRTDSQKYREIGLKKFTAFIWQLLYINLLWELSLHVLPFVR